MFGASGDDLFWVFVTLVGNTGLVAGGDFLVLSDYVLYLVHRTVTFRRDVSWGVTTMTYQVIVGALPWYVGVR